jgi:DNA-directed RNA polymerase subunit RPC12/RpoP
MRIQAAFEKALDQVIPEDESIPLQGRKFIEWEDQADQFDQAVTTTLLEERAALEDSSLLATGELGRCRYCGSDRLYLQRPEPENRMIQTAHGQLELGQQSVRCRSCGRSFSPSGA